MSAKSVLHMKHAQITEIGTGKICGRTGGKNGENTRNLKMTFEWGPSIWYNPNRCLMCEKETSLFVCSAPIRTKF